MDGPGQVLSLLTKISEGQRQRGVGRSFPGPADPVYSAWSGLVLRKPLATCERCPWALLPTFRVRSPTTFCRAGTLEVQANMVLRVGERRNNRGGEKCVLSVPKIGVASLTSGEPWPWMDGRLAE